MLSQPAAPEVPVTIISTDGRSDQVRHDGNVADQKARDGSISSVEIRLADPDRSMFKSALGTALTCLGSAVGTGNVWRFPRILASQSYSKGSLAFYVAWFLLLLFWSIPLLLVEYGVGRFTRNSALPSFCKFMGKYFAWIGGWLIAAVFFISAYYPVIVGWCLYYLFISCTASELPGTEEAGMALFNGFTKDSYWPVFCQILAVALTGAFLFGGIHLVEKANMILVPLLLLILVFTFGWSVTREYAEVGIQFLFTPTWSSFAQPSLWIAAAAQNAFDTGAGMSVLLVYATYMDRSAGVVRYSMLIPVLNNLVRVIVPGFCIFLITWWIYNYIKTNEVWYALSWNSVGCTLLEWLILLVILIAANLFVVWYKGELYPQTRKLGSDPYDPSTYEEWDAVKVDDLRLGSYDEIGTTITVARQF
ncbi:hypothetical protein PHET_02061 [Paragonimus heterotremus]|uniref:Sodium-dependent transporter n=1 Tax=Paragonimus heterotremus TaxID=100268 RepID=A0A8J4SSU0_9TREM|nr:hypothetical protein PHET_02061 [Paragonimus heterotremus]